MANEFSDAAKIQMLNALLPAQLKLHTNDPGAAGTANYAATTGLPTNCTFVAASGTGANVKRVLSAAVDFTGGTALGAVTWLSVWTAAGATFLARAPLTGDNAFNASGEFRVAATTSLTIGDPA